MTDSSNDPRRAIRKLNVVGFALLVLLIGGIGGWASSAQLSGAVIAPGTVVVESNVKKVQHQTGGIVGEILVQEGSLVEAGQIVMRLDDTVPRATLGIVRSQLDELITRQSRLLAERDNADHVTFPDDVLARRNEPTVAAAIAGEEKLFEARLKARLGQQSQLRERVAQIEEEVRGLKARQDSNDEQIKFIAEELGGVSHLYKQNLVSIQRFMQLQREAAKLQGDRGQFVSEIARARGRISEIELQIIQLEQDFRTEVLRELRDGQGKIAELMERRTAAEDQLKRVDIRAPQSGFVHQLAVHTVGGVIAPGELIMLVVPRADVLVVEAKVAPSDIDQVAMGAKTAVRIAAGNQRTLPEITGAVTRIAADLTREQQPPNLAYYVVRVTLPEDQVRRLEGLQLLPGMQAEIFIQTTDRTPLSYLLRPLQEQIARTFRER
jgi:HlyD family secretion protein